MDPGRENEVRRLAACLSEASSLVSSLVSGSGSSSSTITSASQQACVEENNHPIQDQMRSRTSSQRPGTSALTIGQSRLLARSTQVTANMSRMSNSALHTVSGLRQVVSHAEGMMQQASSRGLFKRLSQSERLRSAQHGQLSQSKENHSTLGGTGSNSKNLRWKSLGHLN